VRASGRIVAVQEQRFRLVTDQGQVLLLRLSHDARTTTDELHLHQRLGDKVAVEYHGMPNLASGVASCVEELD
jgi:hypothetical protein